MSDSIDYFAAATGTPSEPGRAVTVDADLAMISLGPGLTSRPLTGANLLASFVRYEEGAEAPRHAHVEEQLFVVLEGELDLDLDGDVRRMRRGDAAMIPAWVPHAAHAIGGPAHQLDVFSPPRAALLALLGAADGG